MEAQEPRLPLFVTVGFSPACFSSGKRTSSIGMARTATVALHCPAGINAHLEGGQDRFQTIRHILRKIWSSRQE